MPTPSPTNGSSANAPALDTSILPLGERAWRRILEHIIAVGDEAETSYLEVKSWLDLSGNDKAATAKIAKFLLGAANRLPRQAARNFQGYAVLVIGAEKDQARGVPRGIEAHELEDRLRPYYGAHFPGFELGRLALEADREVLFIISPPPQEGHSIFPCCKEYQGNNRQNSLENGAIYVRGSSNTRPARSEEVQDLVERARAHNKPPIDLEVTVIGDIHRVDDVEQVLEQWRECQEEWFIEQLSTETTRPFTFASFHGMPTMFRTLDTEQRDAALAEWRSKKIEQVSEGRKYFLGTGLAGAGIQVVSHGRFIAKPHLTVIFHDCEIFDYLAPEHADADKVIEPVLRMQDVIMPYYPPITSPIFSSNYPVEWRNRGTDAEVTLTTDSFRPETSWTSDLDDYVIVSRSPEASSIEVSWVLTEDGNDEVVTGHFHTPTEELVNAAELFKRTFLK
ncbi:hypothetical protein [Actinomyces bowdenii]|uniref:Uncharacterized protein n=1 Tax=Actinomyces bowdenii TaxID=131109 RepID=A0A3P1US73_9ACTO|nr:hypothetical protein [Actinomyces bowdenii]RRD23353.1 hypothetical protein EII10_12010 [Actinomyces bowdenii]